MLKVIDLPVEFRKNIVRGVVGNIGTIVLLLKEPVYGHKLIELYQDSNSNFQVMGGENGALEKPFDFRIFDDSGEVYYLVSDPYKSSLDLFDSNWKLVDRWERDGFPTSIESDHLNQQYSWVMDRRENGQSFLYLFSIEKKKIKNGESFSLLSILLRG